MIQTDRVKALFFDYGGTLDTPFIHWMDVYLQIYTEKLGLELTAGTFRPAYVSTEQRIESEHPVHADTSLTETQRIKTRWQLEHLKNSGTFPGSVADIESLAKEAARLAVYFSEHSIASAFPVIRDLADRYSLVLVSNYYGNLRYVVHEMGLAPYFLSLIDSTVVGIRKPDPALWKIALEESGYGPDEVVVIGDSMKNDIRPALELGCQVIHGTHRLEPEEDRVMRISSLNELLLLL
ncbi:MAG: HAD family hydrolase [Bacteroides sp.]|nr:HAD family hydrolase [Bacteroides sp.]